MAMVAAETPATVVMAVATVSTTGGGAHAEGQGDPPEEVGMSTVVKMEPINTAAPEQSPTHPSHAGAPMDELLPPASVEEMVQENSHNTGGASNVVAMV